MAIAQFRKGGIAHLGLAIIVQDPVRSMIMQTTDTTSTDWRSFNVGHDHAVIFDWPRTGAVMSDRVTGNARPAIAGVARAVIHSAEIARLQMA